MSGPALARYDGEPICLQVHSIICICPIDHNYGEQESPDVSQGSESWHFQLSGHDEAKHLH